MRDYAKLAGALPGLPLAGPSTGAGPAWTQPLPAFLQDQPRVAVVTVHRYGLDHCSKSDPLPTIPRLMSDAAQLGVAQSVATPATEAKARHLPLRIEELNAVACGGEPGVSNTFASALWALQTLFESIRVGVAGVNIHTRTAGVNSLFSAQIVNGRWTAVVKPEYYGLMMFAHAVPPGARLLPTTGTTGDARVHLWAIRLPHGGTRVVFINEDPRRADVITVRIPGRTGATALQRLRAPSLNATAGVTLGGRGFGATTSSGVLSSLQTVAVRATNGSAVVRVPASSAAMPGHRSIASQRTRCVRRAAAGQAPARICSRTQGAAKATPRQRKSPVRCPLSASDG